MNPAPGSDFLGLDIAAAPPGGRAEWLATALRAAIADGRLPVGTRLPPTRRLAAELNVARGTVTEAYRRLTDDGHIEGRGRAGTVVVAAPAAPPRAAPPTPVRPALDAPSDAIFDEMRAVPARVDFTPGVPDLAAFPRAAWLRAERAVLDALVPTDLGYGEPAGHPVLRRAVAQRLGRTRGIRVDPADVVVVAGVAQALALLAQVLRDRGIDAVAVEDPGSLGTRQQLQAWGLATPPVPVDGRGARIDALRALGAPAVLLTPAHQFPTGVVLDGRRRRELMAWAAGGGLVVEDDYDAEHRYDRTPVAALAGMLPEQVCYTGSVSKLLAPALRMGWLVVPPRLRDVVVTARRRADLGGPAISQLVLAHLMDSGELDRTLRHVRTRHRRRRDAMIAALREHLPTAVVHGAAAGLHLTVTFPGTHLSDVDLARAALERGVKVQPLSWHCQQPREPGLVLGYAAAPTAVIRDGVAALGELLSGYSSAR
ncbi:PLP-dependent aminotransferase family protein [Pseudonocardia thermophila]|uniref:MocR-like pyridoxine biosynthesis transcription factor PdxR n=1 Tax=Pseudonocardia thermophila TaxID=1848 RepID=UPI00248E9077|nr:PLP-dependent aminotransferase family protein [Pseudonocardia thermophila]